MALIKKEHVGPKQIFRRLAAIIAGGFVTTADMADMRSALSELKANGVMQDEYKEATWNTLIANVNKVRKFQNLKPVPRVMFSGYYKGGE